jgi:hypothetical protein
MNKKVFRKFGFYSDQDGIINRYIRESGGWDTHLDKTKDFIVKVSKEKLKRKACVLGSGWLLDVPYHELSETFEELVLIDIKHPRQIIHKLRDYKNIHLVEDDITGLVEEVYFTIKNDKKGKNTINLNNIKPLYSDVLSHLIKTADFVVSVNLLNQLDILICDYLKRLKLFSEADLDNFRVNIQSLHLELLPKGKSALITDYEEHNIDNSNQVVLQKKLVYTELPNHKECEKWDWDFDLQGTYNKGLKTIFKVIAFRL